MSEYMMVGCDAHEQSLRLRIAEDSKTSERRQVKSTPEGRTKMIEELKGRAEAAGGASLWVVYEAGAFGIGRHDDLTEAGITCRVLGPSLIPRSSKHNGVFVGCWMLGPSSLLPSEPRVERRRKAG